MVERTEGSAYIWHVHAGAGRQLMEDMPLFGGAAAACILVAAVLTLFSMGEFNYAAMRFALGLSGSLLALCWAALLIVRGLTCLARGRVALQYALTQSGITLTERGRHCFIAWQDMTALKRCRGKLVIAAPHIEMSVLCDAAARRAVEAGFIKFKPPVCGRQG